MSYLSIINNNIFMNAIKLNIKKLLLKQDLSMAEAEDCFKLIMRGEASQVQIASFLTALTMKGESIDEIVAASNVIRQHAEHFNSPSDCLDTCGTGGDGHCTFNISTAVAFVAAGAGVAVAKHGNKAVSSLSGSADILTKLGIKINCEKSLMERALKEANICFMMAPFFHKAMRHVAPVRADLGFRSVFNMLGPLLNPAKAKYQLLGVYSKDLVEPMARVLQNLGTKKALIVHGSDGLDEITLTGKSYVCELDDGNVRSYEIDPENYGMQCCNLDDLKGADASFNAKALQDLLTGKGNKYYKDIVLLNSAAAIYVARKADSIEQGLLIAKKSIDSGAAYEALNKLIAISNEA